MLEDRLRSRLTSREERRMLRSLVPKPSERPPPRTATASTFTSSSDIATDVVDFSSNDYLGLSRAPELERLFLSRVQKGKPFGPPSSRLLDGNSSDHLVAERRLAKFFLSPFIDSLSTTSSPSSNTSVAPPRSDYEYTPDPSSSLLFNSGFDANVSIFSTLPSTDSYVVYDSLIHASVHDGMRSSRCPPSNRRAFRHNDVESLRDVLGRILEEEGQRRQARDWEVFVAVEALYSMDGDLAPLECIVMVLEEMEGRVGGSGRFHLIVDEAHSTGVYGPQGRGLVCALGLERKVLVRLHTFGKAMACSGAVVIVPPLIRAFLINYARPLIYSTVMPRLNVMALESSFDMLEMGKTEELRIHLHELSSYLIARLREFLPYHDEAPSSASGFTAGDPIPRSKYSISLPPHLRPPQLPNSTTTTTTPIIPLLTPSPHALSKFLQTPHPHPPTPQSHPPSRSPSRRAYLIRPIVYPTVPKGMDRVRVCLHAHNTKEEVDGMVGRLERWILLGDGDHETSRSGSRSGMVGDGVRGGREVSELLKAKM